MYNKLLEALEEKGFYNDSRFVEYWYDEEDYNNETYIEDFVEEFFKKEGITSFQINNTSAFDSPGYDCSVLSIAWNDAYGLHLESFLLERC